jgi:hypothetical protein
VTPGGFAPAPGEAATKVDLEAQNDLGRADLNQNRFSPAAKVGADSD